MSAGQSLRFLKGHGTANDFVLLPDADCGLDLLPDLVAALCDRRRGIGGDGVLRVVRTEALAAVDPDVAAGDFAGARWFMDYRNADGSTAEMCGNGIRVVGRYLVDHGLAAPGRFDVATRDGVKHVDVPADGDVTVDMGVVRVRSELGDCRVDFDGQSLTGLAVDAGNPHVVVGYRDLDGLSLTEPPAVTPLGAFPEGTNVEFAASIGHGVTRVRVHERGVGETLSCGTGACAVVAVARYLAPSSPSSYAVDLPGGRLTVTAGPDDGMLLTGPAVIVAEGVVDTARLLDAWADSGGAAVLTPGLAETRS
jgi:diaminopimelate epimerase